MRKEHAEHNEQACDFLLASGLFNDWVVTTAFYAALHFVQNEMFPLEIAGVSYETFEEYYSKHYRQSYLWKNKHTVIIETVKVHLHSAYGHYKWLHDECWNARYKNYKVSSESAKSVRRRLTSLKLCLHK